MRILTFDEFRRNFSIEFALEQESLQRETQLIVDLDFDSFELFRLFIFIEALAPMDMPEGLDIESLDLGSVYNYYAQQAALVDVP